MWEDHITRIGGGIGGVMACLLNINLVHIGEIALFAFIGSAIGEIVKETVKAIQRKRAPVKKIPVDVPDSLK